MVALAFAASVQGQALPACTPVTFEGSNPFSVNGLWHTTTACGANAGGTVHSTPTALYYGIDDTCDFDDGDEEGNEGEATSPPIALPGLAELRFASRRDAEVDEEYDLTEVQYSTDGGTNWTTLLTGFDLPNTGNWSAIRVALPPLSSPFVQIRFTFESGDDISNDTLGWMVDDVQVCAVPQNVPASNPFGLALMAALLAAAALGALRLRRR